MPLPLKKAMDSLFNRCGTIGNYQGREVLFLLIEPDEIGRCGFCKGSHRHAFYEDPDF